MKTYAMRKFLQLNLIAFFFTSSLFANGECNSFDDVKGYFEIPNMFANDSLVNSVVLNVKYENEKIQLLFDKSQPLLQRYLFPINSNTCEKSVEYSYRISYKNTARTFESEIFKTDSSENLLDVEGLPIWDVELDATGLDFEAYREVLVELRYFDNEGNRHEKKKNLSKENSLYSFKELLNNPKHTQYEYRVTFYNDGREIKTQWFLQNFSDSILTLDSNLISSNILAASAEESIFSEIRMVFVDFTVEVGERKIQKSIVLDANNISNTWNFVLNDDQEVVISYSLMIMMKNGIVHEVEPVVLEARSVMITQEVIDQVIED